MNFHQTDRRMMARCVELARSGMAEGELPFGSLVARGESIIAEAVNHSIRESDESRHAEIVAIARARKALGRRTLRECTLYSTVEPCPMCSFVIRAAGIRRVVFALHSPVMGGMTKWDILRNIPPSRRLRLLIGPAPQIVTGVLAEEVHEAWNEWRPVISRMMRILGFFVLRKPESHP
jgi:tRNA(adenine34) deaminase